MSNIGLMSEIGSYELIQILVKRCPGFPVVGWHVIRHVPDIWSICPVKYYDLSWQHWLISQGRLYSMPSKVGHVPFPALHVSTTVVKFRSLSLSILALTLSEIIPQTTLLLNFSSPYEKHQILHWHLVFSCCNVFLGVAIVLEFISDFIQFLLVVIFCPLKGIIYFEWYWSNNIYYCFFSMWYIPWIHICIHTYSFRIYFHPSARWVHPITCDVMSHTSC